MHCMQHPSLFARNSQADNLVFCSLAELLKERQLAAIGDDRRGTRQQINKKGNDLPPGSEKSVIVVGGGVAGMSAACGLADGRAQGDPG